MRTVLSVLYLIGSISVAMADEPPKAAYEVAGGLSLPSGPSDFTTYWTLGPHVSVGISYPTQSTISGLFLLEWNSHALDGTKLLNDAGVYGVDITGGRATIFSGTANLKVSLGMDRSTTLPYVLAGMGVYRISTTDMTLSGPGGSATVRALNETALALQLGVGLSMPASASLAVFVDARYLVGLTKGTSTSSFPIRIGIRTR